MKKFIKILVIISIIISTILLISDVDINIEIDTGKTITHAYHENEGGSNRTSSNELIAKPPSASYEQIYQWAVNNKASDLYLEVLPIIWEKSVEKGVDPVVVAAQCALETGFLSKGNAMSGGHNTCGMKSAKNTNKYAVYDSWSDGFQAQVNHLALYSGISGNQKSWLYGRCKTVKQLTGLWAEDPKYDVKLMSMINGIHNTKVSSDLKVHNDPTKKDDDHKYTTTVPKKNKTKDKSYRSIEKIVKTQNSSRTKINKVTNTIKSKNKSKATSKINKIVKDRNNSKALTNKLKKISKG